MNRLNLSRESLTDSHRTSKLSPTGASGANSSPTENRIQSLAMSELLKPQKKVGATECETTSKKSPDHAVKARSKRQPTSGSRTAATQNHEETGDVLATTCCSILFSMSGSNRGSYCLLVPRHERDQYLMEWFHRELEFLQGRKSGHLLAVNAGQRAKSQPASERYAVEPVADSLETRLARVACISHLEARVILRDALKSLHEYHSQGKLHAELNPNRILFTPDDRLVLFGSPGYKPNEELRPAGGEDCFAAPELLNPEDFGELTESSDLYCLGHIVLSALLGTRYYGLLKVKNIERPTAIECRNWHGSSVDRLPTLESLLPEAPHTLLLVLEKLTRKEREERYQNITEVLADLNATFSKTRKGNLEKKRKLSKPDGFELKLPSAVAGLSVVPPPLLNSEEAKATGQGISGLPMRILIAGGAFLLLAIGLALLFKPATAEKNENETPETLVSRENRKSEKAEQAYTELDPLSRKRREEIARVADEWENEQTHRIEANRGGEPASDSTVNQFGISPEAESVSEDGVEESQRTLTSESEIEEGEDLLDAMGDETEEKDFDTSDRESVLSRIRNRQSSQILNSLPVTNESNVPSATETPSDLGGATAEMAIAQPASSSEGKLEQANLYDHSHATRVFMTRVVKLLDSYQPKAFLKTDKAHAPWFETVAKRLDTLETSEVSPKAISFAREASAALKRAAGALRGEAFSPYSFGKKSELSGPEQSQGVSNIDSSFREGANDVELSRQLVKQLQADALRLFEQLNHAELANK